MSIMTRQERERLVLNLYNQGKTYREISKEARISPRDIEVILNKAVEKTETLKQEHDNNNAEKNQQEQQNLSLSGQAYKFFSEGKTPIEVAIILKIPASKVSKLYREYWDLRGLHQLNIIYKETNGKIWIVLKLYKQLIKKRRMSIEQAANAVEIAIHKLPYMESLYGQAKDQAEKMQHTRQGLANHIEERKKKISLLDNIILSSEQDCKRKEQRVHELTVQKNRIEKSIANILNGEGYSKLKHTIKENVKAALSENKKLISISFVALIQTIKTDPQMVKLIQNIPSANDGEQKKDNNNNITKYLELNKNSLIDLADKHYENLVEALTKNAMDNAASTTSPNPTLSLPQSPQ
jgi:hypothetical protein